ncbi:hypothetical protein LSAT2_031583 [Lamellibrachia satsuma]|nr:hypothetical protein LSAT2_031583 [Lamellibrachia satsuma]
MKTKILLLLAYITSLHDYAATFSNEEAYLISHFAWDLMKCHGNPGLTMAATNGRWTRSYWGTGKRMISPQDRMMFTTKINIGALSKAFTATLAAEAVNSNAIEWDTPIRDVLGESFQLHDEFRTTQTTLRDLLSHRLGVPEYMGAYFADKSLKTADNIGKMETAHDFRSGFDLSTYSYVLARRVIEKVRGKSWEMDVRETIFNKLNMLDSRTQGEMSWFDWTDTVLSSKNGNSFTLDQEKDMLSSLCPAGCVLASPYDFVWWMKFHLTLARNRSKTGPDPGNAFHALYEPTSVPPPLHYRPPTFPVEFSLTSYGLGFYIGRYRGHKMLAHDGAHGHSGCMLTLLPDKDISVFTCVNGYKPPSRPELTPTVLNMFIMDILLGHATPWITSVTGCSFPRPWSEPANIPQEWTPGKDSIFYQRNHTHHTFDDYYEGTYVHPGFGIIKITTKLGVLQFEYKELRGQLKRSQWRDMYYLILTENQRDMLNAPPDGYPVYFAVGNQTRYVNKMAVTVLDRSVAPVFTRQHPLEWESSDGTVDSKALPFVIFTAVVMVLFIV